MKVDIQTITTISCNDCKAIPVPANLIQEHGGRQWLKLRPTCQQLNQIIYGKVGKNASFSNHTGFQDFITKRNQLWARGAGEDQPQETVYEESDQSTQRTKAKKRRLDDPEVLQVPLGEATIECLMQGQRPTKSDLVMPLEESQLVPMFELLQEHQDTLKTRKPYQKKASVPKD